MKFTLGWLRDYLEFDLPVSELCERLTSIGLEVEDFFDPQKKYKNFVLNLFLHYIHILLL